MTPSDALTILFVKVSLSLFDDKVIEAHKTLTTLIAKAEPMKPIIRVGNQGLFFYECPRCHTHLAQLHYFCPKKDCGQAIDWSDEK